MGKGSDETFSKENMQMTNKHMKRSLTSLATRKMHIKPTMSQHLTHTRIAIITMTGNKKSWLGYRVGIPTGH